MKKERGHLHRVVCFLGYSKLGARGKDSQKLMFSKKKRALISYFSYFPQNYGDLYKKKERPSLRFDLVFRYFSPKIIVISKKTHTAK